MSDARVIARGDGTPIDLPFGRPRIKFGSGDGREQIALLESELPPGGGFAVPHWHDDLDEGFYVVEGEIEFLLGDEWHRAGAGTTVFVPAGTVHAFRNAGDVVARQLVFGAVEAIELVRSLAGTPPERLAETFGRYRSHVAAR